MRNWRQNVRAISLWFAVPMIGACAPYVEAPGPEIQSPRLVGEAPVVAFHTGDGVTLPVRQWNTSGKGEPKAIIIAVHGFNDYSFFFMDAGKQLGQKGILTYAYDQRGFGEAPNRGLWAGYQAYAQDLLSFAKLIRQRHPQTPLYLLGESMGGAIVIVTATADEKPPVDGVILSAPAVWGRATMPWYQRLALWTGVRLMPWKTLTGSGLRILASDNIKMLQDLGRDPLFIKATRIDTMYGVSNLMDAALERSRTLTLPRLILYGEKDQVIPHKPTRLMLRQLPENCLNCRIAVYENGYHMLLRDLQAEVPIDDIAHWIMQPATPLPSGAENRVSQFINAN